jgi:predicted nucleotidyltransferase
MPSVLGPMAREECHGSLDAGEMLDLVRSSVLQALGDQVVAMYLFGSLATGDFDEGVSDIDVLVATAQDLSTAERDRLHKLHRRLGDEHREWNDRVEVIYVSTEALRTFLTKRSALSVTSPGEPFHTITGGRDWLVNWYNVQESGRALFGPPAAAVIATITLEQVREEIRHQVSGWRARVRSSTSAGSRAYAVLTLARAWDTISNGVVRSKLQSAQWAKEQLPEWAELIERAVRVRAASGLEGQLDAAEAARFVDEVARRVAAQT